MAEAERTPVVRLLVRTKHERQQRERGVRVRSGHRGIRHREAVSAELRPGGEAAIAPKGLAKKQKRVPLKKRRRWRAQCPARAETTRGSRAKRGLAG